MKQYSRRASILACRLIVIAGLLVTLAPDSRAMPNFTRQYGIQCSSCHTVIPRLSQAGYEFRRAGFRMPNEIGKERDQEKNYETSGWEFANYFTARLQSNISYVRRDHANANGSYNATGGTYSNNQIEFLEFTLYPLTGGFLKNWSAETEISGGTDSTEVENAWVRYDRGSEKSYWEARLGVMHPFEGYGASDRTLGLTRPLIQAQGTVNANGDPNGWHPWGFDETGIEWGFTRGGSNLSLTVFNGLVENAADPAQGAGLKKAAGSPTEKDKDFQLFFHQFFGNSEAAVSAFYYNGRISLGAPTLYEDKFDRWAVYGTYPIHKVWLLGAYSGGQDKDALTGLKAKNDGWFFEVDGYLSEKLGVGGRYEMFDPSDLAANNDVKAASAFLNIPGNNGLQLVAELKNKKTEKGVNLEQTENSVNVRLIYIW